MLSCEARRRRESRSRSTSCSARSGAGRALTGYGLEELGIADASRGRSTTDAFLQTRYPNIYACGDVAGPYQFTHTAAHQAWYAAVNALFGDFGASRADYRVIPWCTFTDPEVARVGLNEQRGDGAGHRARGHALRPRRARSRDRRGRDHGLRQGADGAGQGPILGVTIVGEHAGELIAEYVLAMKHGIGLNKILGTIHIYPTLAEANKYVAGEWKRQHQPERLLAWVRRYHAWRRA